MPNLISITQPESLSKLAYRALLKSILAGDMQPYEMYTEMVLAKDLGISRTPVREALLELSSQGLVTFLPRKGVIINQFKDADIKEIFEVRRAVEGFVVETLANFSPPPEFSLVKETLEKQRKAMDKDDFMSFLESDREFHVTLSKLTGNSRIVAISENLRNMIHLMGTQALMLSGRAEAVIREHELIIEKIKKGNPAEARGLMIDHLVKSEAAVKETVRKKRDGKEL